MFKAKINYLSVYIGCDDPYRHIEVYYISLPRFYGSHCSYYSLEQFQKNRLDKALLIAQECLSHININMSDIKIQSFFTKLWEHRCST